MKNKKLLITSDRIDPLSKVAWFLSCGAIAFTQNIILVSIITLSAIIGFIASRAYRSGYLKIFVLLFIFFTIIFLMSVKEYETPNNIIAALITTSKWIAITLSALAFFAMTSPFDLSNTLIALKLPKGFAFALGMGFRFVPIIVEEGSKIYFAQKARGLDVGKGFQKVKKFPLAIASLFLPLFNGMLMRLETMYLSLRMRGFNLSKIKKSEPFVLNRANILLLAYAFAVIILVIVF